MMANNSPDVALYCRSSSHGNNDNDNHSSHVSVDGNESSTDTISTEWDEGIVDGASDDALSMPDKHGNTISLSTKPTQKRILQRLKNIRKTRQAVEGIGRKEFSYTILGSAILAIAVYQTLRIGLSLWLLLPFCVLLSIPLFVAYFIFFSHFIKPKWMSASTTEFDGVSSNYIEFNQAHLRNLYSTRRVPILTFLDAYVADEADLVDDQTIQEVLIARDSWANFGLPLSYVTILLEHWMSVLPWGGKVLHDNRSPSLALHEETFLQAFLGSSMRQACGMINVDKNSTLMEMQEQALHAICQTVQLSRGKRHLDVGCGYGQLVRHATQHYGATSTGIASDIQKIMRSIEYANQANLSSNQANFQCIDYRDVRDEQYDAITCIGQNELLSIHQLPQLLHHLYGLLKDDGILLLQVDTMRTSWQLEDVNWNLFVDNYVFPGFEMLLPLQRYIRMVERSGFEVVSVENLNYHAAATYGHWYDQWEANQSMITEKYGKRHWRIWAAYLAWTSIALRQGTTGRYQIVAHKNINAFDRTTMIRSHDNTPHFV